MTPTIDIYTDGSCLANPGPGGWAAIIEHDGETDRLSGGERSTTNNRMEITAAIKGLDAVPVGATAVVHSDSEYLVKTMTKGWKRNANRDLWEQLDRLATRRNVDFRWVRGHAGHPQNEEADRLAVRAMQSAAGRTLPLETAAGGPPPPAAPSPGLTHIDAQGAARMVDVGAKPDSDRFAAAAGTVTMRPETLALILQGKMEKGDVFTVARIAGVNAAKHTWELIPLAHQIPLSHVEIDFDTDPPKGRVTVSSRARTTAKTGVEMEALTAVAIAALTIYDMCKAVDRSMTIGDVRLLEKTGGVHGDYKAQ